MQIIK